MNSERERLSNIYDILVSDGGANCQDKESFIDYHLDDNTFKEWRFQGHLGFGGKYRYRLNEVDCYAEDEWMCKELIKEINKKLKLYDKA